MKVSAINILTNSKETSGYLSTSFSCPYCCFISVWYGISGCGVFKAGIQNYKGFWLKINCIQMKLPNFENWSIGELSKIGHHFSNKRR